MSKIVKKNEIKTLVFDIETGYIPVGVWRFGKQVVTIDQVLDDTFCANPIICICYRWLHENKSHVLTWDENCDSTKMIIEFDNIIKQADVIVGQNSNDFDVKHVNTHRLIHGLPPLPKWLGVTFEDTVKMLRETFAFPSNKLDYLSRRFLKRGGKIKMEFRDWIILIEKLKGHKAMLKKFTKYGCKDVDDTVELFKLLLPHCVPKYNAANSGFACVRCGGNTLVSTYVRQRGMCKYQYFHCVDCECYAGKARVLANGKLSNKMST